MSKGGPPISSARAKVAWLLAHEPLWTGMPSLFDWPFKTEYRRTIAELRHLMTDAGLYSPKSYAPDVEISILNHINRARRQRARERSQPRG